MPRVSKKTQEVKKEAVKEVQPMESTSRKSFVGTIISDKMQNTVVVAVERKIQHPMYKKIIKRTRKFKADMNGMSVVVGDVVKIEEGRKMSKDKSFKVVAKIEGK